MTSVQFCFWLQGFFELRKAGVASVVGFPNNPISAQQADIIERHLALVFKHEIDPAQGSPSHQAELQAVHDGKPLANNPWDVDSDGVPLFNKQGETLYRC